MTLVKIIKGELATGSPLSFGMSGRVEFWSAAQHIDLRDGQLSPPRQKNARLLTEVFSGRAPK